MYLLNCVFIVFSPLYKCTGRAIALSPGSALETCYFLCDGQGSVWRAILYADRFCKALHLNCTFTITVYSNMT